MKINKTGLALIVSSLILTGCQGMSTDSMINTGMKAFEAATLSDADVANVANQACAQSDSQNQIASDKSKYNKRLQSIASKLGDNVDGHKLNYKVYLTEDVNAWAMANGCVRVYSGLMDIMNDDEVAAVVGHEIGHVAKGHSKKALQTAYMASIARDAAAQSSNQVVSTLSQSQLGDIGEALINAQFSQSQEKDADDYSLALLKKRGLNPEGLITSFEKLAKLDGGRKSSMFDSHPASADRAERIREQIKNGN